MRYLFEEYAFDTDRRELHRGADVVSVAPQVFDLLDFLIRNRERVVSKDDLINTIWNGRSVSDAALTTRLNVARSAIGDTGEEQRLIKTLPRKGFRFVAAVREAQGPAGEAVSDTPAEQPKPALPLPDKPSIAVLPFDNMSGDPEQDYFADGMVEDIITALSRFKALFVIARNSSFTYKGRAVDVKQVGRELGVRYVLEGSVRKAGNRVRITGQLVDAATGGTSLGRPVRWRRSATSSTCRIRSPRASSGRSRRRWKKPRSSVPSASRPRVSTPMPSIYVVWPGFFSLVTGKRTTRHYACSTARSSSTLDFAAAYGRAANCYVYAKGNSWISVTPKEIAEVTRLAQRAVELGKDDAMALATGGYALMYVAHDLGVGAGLIDRALVLNSNLAEAWNFGGWVKNWLGEPEAAIERFAHAMRLSPLDPRAMTMRSGTAYAYFLLGRYDEAASWAAMALQDSPDFQPGLRQAAASNAMAGRPEQARKAMARLRKLNPALRVSNLKDVLGPYQHAEDLARYGEGLRQAGLPE